jgi:hypothetical protein
MAISGYRSQCESTAPAHDKTKINVQPKKLEQDAKIKCAERAKPTAGNAGGSDDNSVRLLPTIEKVRHELGIIDILGNSDPNRVGDHRVRLSVALRDLENQAAENDLATIDVSQAVLSGTNYKPKTAQLYIQMVSDHQLTLAANALDTVNVGYQNARKVDPECYRREVETAIDTAADAVVGSWSDEDAKQQDKTPTAQVQRLIHLLSTCFVVRDRLSDKLFNAVMDRCVLKIMGSTDPAAVQKLKDIISKDPTLSKSECQDSRINGWLNKHSVLV